MGHRVMGHSPWPIACSIVYGSHNMYFIYLLYRVSPSLFGCEAWNHGTGLKVLTNDPTRPKLLTRWPCDPDNRFHPCQPVARGLPRTCLCEIDRCFICCYSDICCNERTYCSSFTPELSHHLLWRFLIRAQKRLTHYKKALIKFKPTPYCCCQSNVH